MKKLLFVLLLVSLVSAIIFLINSSSKVRIKPQEMHSEIFASPKADSSDKSYYNKQRQGQVLFQNYCASCHNKNMKDDLDGPALEGVTLRWQNDTSSILGYLKSPSKYFSSHPSKRMMQLHEQFGNKQKPSFENFTIEDVKGIIEYIEAYCTKPPI